MAKLAHRMAEIRSLRKALLALFSLSLGFWGCASEPNVAPSVDTSARSRFLVLVSPESPTMEQFQRGADRRAKKLGIELIWMHVGEESLEAAQLRTLTESPKNVGCVIIQPGSRKALQAVEAWCQPLGMPMVLAWSGLEPESAATYVGAEAREIGVKMAEAIIRAEPTEPTTIGFVRLADESFLVSEAGKQCRLRLRATLNLDVVEPADQVGSNPDAATATCLRMLQGWQDEEGNLTVKWIVCPDALSAESMIQALKAKSLTGKVLVASLEASPKLAAELETGVLSALALVRADRSGESAIQAGYDYLRGGNPRLYDYEDVAIGTQENLKSESIAAYLEAWRAAENEEPK